MCEVVPTRRSAITDQNPPDPPQYKQLIETLPIGYARTTLDGEFRAVNSTFVSMVGGESRDDILSRGVEEFYQDPATREAILEALAEKGEVHDEELKVTTLSGETVWVLVTARVVETDAERCFDAFVQDITDRRRREEILREIHTVISNRDRTFEQQVQSLLELGRAELDTEYGTLSEIRGDDYIFKIVSADDDSIQPGDVVPVSATNCEIAASTDQTLVLGDIERDAPEETDRAGYAEWGVSCYLGAPVLIGDEVYGTFCFYDSEARSGQFSTWEVTLVDLMSRWVSSELERERANAELQRTNAELQRTNEQLEQFSSVVSHDLRNPLNVAQGRAKLAAEEHPSEHLDAVIRAHDRMEALIEDLLRLTLAGEQVDEMEPIDPSVFGDAWWRNIDTRAATLRVNIDRRILADPNRLQQLFENLVRNSVEHGSTGSRADPGDSVEHGEDGVTVTIGALPDGFYVEDDGRGIPAAKREDVLESGFSTADGGTGIGLRIVEQVVDAHGWEIEVTESAEGGARFEISGVEFAED